MKGPQLVDPDARAALVARLRRLGPDTPRRWGRMTAHQAICHMNDSFRAVMNPGAISISNVFTRTVVRWVAIHTSLRWPQGVRTIPEVDQEIGGTTPADFAHDCSDLQASMERFVRFTGEDLQPHPVFGPMSTAEWQRWAWLHVDHHLRQFGV